MPLNADAQKQLVARHAVRMIEHGMRVGLGTGSTATYLVRELGTRWEQGLRFTAVATSQATHALASEHGLTMVALDDVHELDIALDGADEVNPHLDLIKGLGGALLREKLVESVAIRLVIMVDASKPVELLGSKTTVPVEVVPFGWKHTARRLEAHGLHPVLRGGTGAPFTTDGGHYILDCRFTPLADAQELAAAVKGTPGVVEHGFFLGMATDLLIGQADGTVMSRQRRATV